MYGAAKVRLCCVPGTIGSFVSVQPDGGEGLMKRKGLAARQG
jgi:hypothetical protein